MSNLSAQVEQSIRTRKLFPSGQRLLVAVSGGVDSMVLLHLLHALAPRHGWRLTVAHFNHQLRGRSSDADERLVVRTAQELGLEVFVERGDVRKLARVGKVSIEMAARVLRHAFLAVVAEKLKIRSVALAHHAGDQVELFFLRLLRGSSGEGLAGMKWHNPSPSSATVELVRPLLDVSKAELAEFARENQIQFREDASNVSLDFQRNRIRRELLPLLRKSYSPALDQVVLRTMEIVGAEAEFVSAAARDTNKRTFTKLSAAVQRRVLQQQLLEQGLAPEFELIERLRLQPNVPATVGSRLSVARDDAGRLRFVEPPTARFQLEQLRLDLRKRSGGAVFAGAKLRWKIERQVRFVRPQPVTGQEVFDADMVGGEVVLRHWRAGDRFQPIGMKVAVKLQDLFVNAKIPRARRRGLIVATTAGGEIFWVAGLRIGERFKLHPGTKCRLRWRWKMAG